MLTAPHALADPTGYFVAVYMVTPSQPHLEGWDKPAVGMVEQASSAEWVLPRVEETYQESVGSHR